MDGLLVILNDAGRRIGQLEVALLEAQEERDEARRALYEADLAKGQENNDGAL